MPPWLSLFFRVDGILKLEAKVCEGCQGRNAKAESYGSRAESKKKIDFEWGETVWSVWAFGRITLEQSHFLFYPASHPSTQPASQPRGGGQSHTFLTRILNEPGE